MRENVTTYIHNNFGSKAGLIQSVKHSLLYHCGRYSQYGKIDWSRVERVCFACMGNICRSPVAEAVFKNESIECCSFGIECTEGVPANERAQRFSKEFNLNLDSHRATPISKMTFDKKDLIVCMEPIHLIHIKKHDIANAQIALLGLWLEPAIAYIHDPYSASDVYFRKAIERVVTATECLKQKQ